MKIGTEINFNLWSKVGKIEAMPATSLDRVSKVDFPAVKAYLKAPLIGTS
ncbi:MAG TPA: hypothetical protein TECP_01353 [Hyphomicrobiaceae bacterium MAG_BT-2024]